MVYPVSNGTEDLENCSPRTLVEISVPTNRCVYEGVGTARIFKTTCLRRRQRARCRPRRFLPNSYEKCLLDRSCWLNRRGLRFRFFAAR
jgi:hypothetical protein